MNKKTISKTIKNNLCISCGVCKSICPQQAITMILAYGQFVPQIDDLSCNHCGLCFVSCPGIDLCNDELKADILQTKPYCVDCFTSYSNNSAIRKNAASGGIITGLIIELLSNNYYDNAFVVTDDGVKGNEVFLTEVTSVKDVTLAAKSKYLPVSAEKVFSFLKEQGRNRSIIVATPCVLLGIKKALKILKINDSSILFLGLFCDMTMNTNFLSYIEKKFSKGGEKLAEFNYRSKIDNGWPGNLFVKFDSGRELIVDKSHRMKVKKYFQLTRCLFCYDKLNVSADISLGDCYIKGEESLLGKSNIIIRTDKGKLAFEKCNQALTNAKIDFKTIFDSQQTIKKHSNYCLASSFLGFLNKGIEGKVAFKLSKACKRKLENIRIGKNNMFYLIKIKEGKAMIVPFVKKVLKKIYKYLVTNYYIIIVSFLAFTLRGKKTLFDKTKTNVVIVGGGLFNKGAQAMTFAVVNMIHQNFPDKKCILFSKQDADRSEDDKSNYTFSIFPWSIDLQLSAAMSPFKRNKVNKSLVKQCEAILHDTYAFVDVSGLALSSKFGWRACLSYSLNVISARKRHIPFISLPQSVGPFNFKFSQLLQTKLMLKCVLPLINTFFVRENEGFNLLKKYSQYNSKLAFDLVLQTEEVNPNIVLNNFHITKNTCKINKNDNNVAIVPNSRVMERVNVNKLMDIYSATIEQLLCNNYTVWLLRHSYEDLKIIRAIKESFSENNKVILLENDFSCFDLIDFEKKLSFIIASRYHSIIHAYKHGVPAIIIGWATKYNELSDYFHQDKYNFECFSDISKKDFLLAVNRMMVNYKNESRIIQQQYLSMQRVNFASSLQ